MSVTSYGSLGSPGSVAFRGNVSGDCLGHSLVKELAKKYSKHQPRFCSVKSCNEASLSFLKALILSE
uniref:Uncharacterized protein n=1 Tax=Ditylenchus dipsaci TaxID=166011 RepID=A0A915DKN1_9BILA